MVKLSLFLGKGGVGKTTVSSAYAVAHASRNPRLRFALLSSDPAHSLGDIFEEQYQFSDEFRPVRLPYGGSLRVAQIDAAKGLSDFLAEHRPELLDLLQQGTLFDRQDLEPLLDSALPGMAEIAALLRLNDLLASREFDEIIVDTAPMGHTLRLLELPQTFLHFLDFLELAGSRDQVLAATFGGSGRIRGKFVAQWRENITRLLQELSSSASQIVMVSSPEQFSLREVERSISVLGAMQPALAVTSFVLNRVPKGGVCSRCNSVAAMAARVEARLLRLLPDSKVRVGQDDGAPIMGAAQLKAFGDEVFYGKRRRAAATVPRTPMPEFHRSAWPLLKGEIGFSIGKGGVGKTTMAAAVGFHTAEEHPQLMVSVCSADPAPSLAEVFAKPMGEARVPVAGRENLLACELNAQQEFRRWANPLQARIEHAFHTERRGLHVELAFEKDLFASILDIVPPGVDELFAVLRIADLAAGKKEERLIVDMAPTGHALELLRTPARMLAWSRLLMKSLAPHRKLPLAQEIAVEIASVSQRVRTLEELLSASQVWMVMLAEPLPDRESSRLQSDLDALGLSPGAVFMNRILVRESACLRCRRARAWQAKSLAGWQRRPGQRIYIVPEFPSEIVGAARLKRFTRSILEWH
ncbi:MAG: ArsA family ATPase [Acidobacteriaceae bacterium]